MKFEGNYKLQATPERVWILLTSPVYLKAALPGCERIEEKAPGEYEALLKIGIAAFKGTYKSRFALAKKNRPCSYRLIGGGGGRRGTVTGDAFVRLVGHGGHTFVSFQADIELSGALSNVSLRLFEAIAKTLLNQYFKRLGKILVTLE